MVTGPRSTSDRERQESKENGKEPVSLSESPVSKQDSYNYVPLRDVILKPLKGTLEVTTIGQLINLNKNGPNMIQSQNNTERRKTEQRESEDEFDLENDGQGAAYALTPIFQKDIWIPAYFTSSQILDDIGNVDNTVLFVLVHGVVDNNPKNKKMRTGTEDVEEGYTGIEDEMEIDKMQEERSNQTSYLEDQGAISSFNGCSNNKLFVSDREIYIQRAFKIANPALAARLDFVYQKAVDCQDKTSTTK